VEIRGQSRARTHGDDGSRTEVCGIGLAAANTFFLLKDRDPSSSSSYRVYTVKISFKLRKIIVRRIQTSTLKSNCSHHFALPVRLR
jgi:hypothetical protein